MSRKKVLAVLIAVVCMAGAVTAVGAAPLTIGAVLFGQDSFFQNIQIGIEQGAKAAGANVLVNIHNHEIDKETSFIEDYIARGVQAIVITPESLTASAPEIKKAYEAGIKIVCFNTNINDDDAKKYVSAFYETDQSSLGYQTGQYLVKWLKSHKIGDVTVGILQCDRFEACKRRGDGFRKALNEANVKWTEAANQEGFMPDVGSTVAENILQANPRINILWSENEGGTIGEVIAVRSMKLQGKVFVFGTDMSTQLADFLLDKDNILQAVTGQSPRVMGSDSVKAAVAVVKGSKVDYYHVVPNAFFSRDNVAAINAFKKEMGQ
ncbi:MAG TPA: substrate-binding domain-containing protein [Spirochaetia bacterium]|nr:substrate-binding domain-containing protein [Spirochaetia bacterium]